MAWHCADPRPPGCLCSGRERYPALGRGYGDDHDDTGRTASYRAEALGEDLAVAGVLWRHLPVPDFGAPPEDTLALWPEASETAHRVLADGGKVMAHCFGGCGRAGMALMRLMVEAGEEADPALERLRDARPCAVQSETQRAWAAIPMFQRNGWTS